jgi:hypothetical protein
MLIIAINAPRTFYRSYKDRLYHVHSDLLGLLDQSYTLRRNAPLETRSHFSASIILYRLFSSVTGERMADQS